MLTVWGAKIACAWTANKALLVRLYFCEPLELHPMLLLSFFLVHLCTARDRLSLCLAHSPVWSVGTAGLVAGLT